MPNRPDGDRMFQFKPTTYDVMFYWKLLPHREMPFIHPLTPSLRWATAKLRHVLPWHHASHWETGSRFDVNLQFQSACWDALVLWMLYRRQAHA